MTLTNGESVTVNDGGAKPATVLTTDGTRTGDGVTMYIVIYQDGTGGGVSPEANLTPQA